MVYRVDGGEMVLNREGCVGTRLYENAGNEYVHLAIDPGGEIPAHALPIPVDFCVLKGVGIATVDGAAQEVAVGQMLSCPPHVSRGWKNEDPEKLEILVIKHVWNG